MDNSPSRACGRVYIETYGCAFNTSDSEVMAGLLARAGFSLVGSAEHADAVILNSCTVKERSYLNLRKRIQELSSRTPSPPPALVLAGCVPRVLQHAREFATLSQIGPDNLACLPEVVARTLAGECVHAARRQADAPRLNLPKQRRNAAIEIVPISRGCLGSCTYCQTVIARGRLVSFAEEQIVAQIESALAEGVSLIWLTSQDCGAYGLDRATNLPRLLRRVAAIPGDFRVRVGMANPDFVKIFLDPFAEALSHPKFFQFAHIPVQSGSDAVLRAMGRAYSSADFLQICEALRARLPQVTLATDIIAGFPTESEDDFAQTLALLRQGAPPTVNRSRYSPRPGTRAARLPQLASKVITGRSKLLTQLVRELWVGDARRWVGWQGEAVIEDASTPQSALARNFAYKPIVLSGAFRPGQHLAVRVTSVEGFHLRAQAVAG